MRIQSFLLKLLLVYSISFGLNIDFSKAQVCFRHMGMKEGLSQSSVKSIYQDELGRMWFGTLEGINIYDGTFIRSLKPAFFFEKNFYIGNQIHNITGDGDGNVFFTSNDMLVRYDIRQNTLSHIRKKNVSCLAGNAKDIWAAVSDTILKWDKEKQIFDCIYILQPGMGKRVSELCHDDERGLWIGTEKGLFLLDKKMQSFENIIKGQRILSLYKDSQGNIWVAPFRNGMYRISGDTLVAKHYIHHEGKNSLSNNTVREFVEDDLGNIWIATYQGVNKLDRNGYFCVYTKGGQPGDLKHESVYALYKDKQGTLWVGTYYGGVSYYNPQMDIFEYYVESKEGAEGLSYSFVGNMLEDKENNVWICTEGGGLNLFLREERKFVRFPNTRLLPYNNMKCVAYEDKQEKLYIGTYGGGLVSFDIPTGKISQVCDISTYGRNIWDVAIYKSSLLFMSEKGLFLYDFHSKEVNPFFKKKPIHAIKFTIDSKGYIWLNGVWKIARVDLSDKQKVDVYNVGEYGLGNFPVSNIIEDHYGNILLGTAGGGLYCFNEATGFFSGYNTRNNALMSDYCYKIVPDTKGHLLVATDKGVMFWDSERKQVLRTIELNRFSFSGMNEDNGMLVCSNGEIFVGGIDGMTVFKEEKIRESKPYDLYFSALYINNELITPDRSKILSSSIPFVEQLNLSYNQNNIMLHFASNNYTGNLHHIEYEYKLEGFAKEWITCQNKNIAYTNLNPGRYCLLVRERPVNEKSDADLHTIRLKIVIHNPWFASWYAYFLYFMIIFMITYWVYRNRKAKADLKLSYERERFEREKNEEITQEKIRFFANISHELRTPLTFIISQIEVLLHNYTLSPSVNQRLNRVYRNTFQLRELISELLNFRRLERGGIQLKVREFDLVRLLQDSARYFKEQAALKHIKIETRIFADSILCWGDERQLIKVFNNLLSNAIKYSLDMGEIIVCVEEETDEIVVKIVDNGIGIKSEELPKIFERFYQSENNNISVEGTGIGLALAKGIVDLHHGTIDVKSELGYGSVFIVKLKKGNVHFIEDDNVEICKDAVVQQAEELPNDLLQLENQDIVDAVEAECPDGEELLVENKNRILIVEDDEELLLLLSEIFSPMFQVIVAMNGKEGLEKAIEELPDLILSDVMMPEMTGIEMCSKIKQRLELCHIPVVLLTALTSEQNNIEGLQCGADDYVSKPFNTMLLVARCKNLIYNRMLLRQQNASGKNREDLKNVRELASNELDQKFLLKLNEIIEKFMSDPLFDINMLAREAGVSRSTLYGKLKALYGMTPNELILNRKMERATRLLRTSNLSMTEISDSLGFNSLRCFRTVFKVRLGKTPQEYKTSYEGDSVNISS